ncbi:MAG: hypothetical protein WD696_02455 [Bryobacteraceae bacterium]
MASPIVIGARFGSRAESSSTAMDVHLDGNRLTVSAPGFHFITGRPLQRLKDGTSVNFASQLSLLADSVVVARGIERFSVSYDLWEEKFSVVRVGRSLVAKSRSSVSHLSSAEAEIWCIENLWLDTAGLSPKRNYHLRLEVRVEERKEDAGLFADPGINLARLVDFFSRSARSQQSAQVLERGPIQLADLKSSVRRGS